MLMVFVCLAKQLIFFYKCTEYYDPQDEGGVRWDDPLLNIKWPFQDQYCRIKIKNIDF